MWKRRFSRWIICFLAAFGHSVLDLEFSTCCAFDEKESRVRKVGYTIAFHASICLSRIDHLEGCLLFHGPWRQRGWYAWCVSILEGGMVFFSTKHTDASPAPPCPKKKPPHFRLTEPSCTSPVRCSLTPDVIAQRTSPNATGWSPPPLPKSDSLIRRITYGKANFPGPSMWLSLVPCNQDTVSIELRSSLIPLDPPTPTSQFPCPLRPGASTKSGCGSALRQSLRLCRVPLVSPALRLDVSGVHVEIQDLSALSGVYANWGWKDIKWRRGHACFFAFLLHGLQGA